MISCYTVLDSNAMKEVVSRVRVIDTHVSDFDSQIEVVAYQLAAELMC